MARSSILEFFKPIVGFLIKLAPYVLTWIALTILFIIMPNTKVKFNPALISGIVAGTILQFLQWLYIDLQFGISKLSAIYGSFAAIPLFIIWVQSSWIILLLGAELSFANQNVSRYEFESEVNGSQPLSEKSPCTDDNEHDSQRTFHAVKNQSVLQPFQKPSKCL